METDTMGRKRLPEIPVRTEWHQSARGCWSLTLGERGCRVRIEQKKKGGVFKRVAWIPGRGRSQKSLMTTSRTEARARGEAFLRALLAGDTPAPRQPLTLGELWIRYSKEAPGYRKNTDRVQREKAARAELLLLGLGNRTTVERLTLNDVDLYGELRSRGTGWPDGRATGKVGPRSVAQDLAVLRTMILWACKVREPDGSRLLAENPLKGMQLPVEPSPVRPVATYDRFIAVRTAMKRMAKDATSEIARTRWVRVELALVLAEAAGRRIGSIRGLRWADIDFDEPSITWRKEFDKRRREQKILIPTELADELRSFRAQLEAFGDGWLFPLETKDGPWDRKVFDRLLREAEKAAKTDDGKPLERLRGALWHAYRRKWATERKHLPAVDVMAAGGWKSRQTMETCYQQATDAGVLEVMASPVKLRERKASGKA